MGQHREERLLDGPTPEFDASAALRRVQRRIQSEGIVPSASWAAAIMTRLSLARSAWTRPVVAATAVVLIASAAAVTGVADTVLTVFEPKQVATIQLDPRQMRGIPDPAEYGTLTWIVKPSEHAVADASAAAAEAGFAPLIPASLPAGVPSTARFGVMPQAKATFQFDEAKARAAAAISATTLTLTGGPAIIQQYGGATTDPPGEPTLRGAGLGAPRLIVVQAKAPVVTSNGATVNELRDYALAQPGIPPAVATQIRAIDDPVRTLLLPIGVDLKDARTVTVRGTQGYLVGDQTGLGSGVVWLERGYVIGVLGSLPESELIALVNALR